MTVQDYIPHGIVTAFAAVVSWVYREHVKQDDGRFKRVGEKFEGIDEKLERISTKMSDNHAEILRLLIKEQDRR